MPSNRRTAAAFTVAFLLVALAASPAQAAGRGEARGWWALVWSWFVSEASGREAAVLGYSVAVDPDGRAVAPEPPPAPTAESVTLGHSVMVDPNGRAVAPEPPPAPAAGLAGADEQ